MRNRICLIEDDDTLQMLISYELKNAGYEISVAGDGEEGLQLLQKQDFDLAIIDWMLPNLSGLDIIKEIRKENPNLSIIMLTAKDGEMDIVEGLNYGADDYMTKPFSMRELQARLKSMLRKGNNKVIKVNNLLINLDTRTVTKNDVAIAISKLEFDILLFLINNKGKVLSREAIFNHLWPNDSDTNPRVIDNHISNLKKKLGLKDNIITKRGVGYLFVT